MADKPVDSVATRGATRGGYAFVNGIHLYHEIHDSGAAPQPLVLLHGGLGSIEMFADILPLLAKGRQVIGVDLQAHGRTADIDRPLRFEWMADDVAALVRHLGFDRVDILGYSLGGGTAIQAAIRHPELVRKLVLVSAPFKREGWYPEVLAGMEQIGPQAAEMMKQGPLYQLYASIAPKPEDWPLLVTKTGQLLSQPYDWSAEAARITAHPMIVVGDADSVRTAYAVEMFALLGGGQADANWDESNMPRPRLAILPATSHYRILSSPLFLPAVIPFLDAPVPESR